MAMNSSEYIKQLIEQLGLSQRKAAKALGVKTSAMLDYCSPGYEGFTPPMVWLALERMVEKKELENE